jgi:hypothetical protein
MTDTSVADRGGCFGAGRERQLITMGAHGSWGLERLVLGSVADKGARGCETPVLGTRVLAP